MTQKAGSGRSYKGAQVVKGNFKKSVVSSSVTALIAGLLVAVTSVAPANATHPALDAANVASSSGDINYSLFVATVVDTTAALSPATAVGTSGHSARSTGLTAKSTATAGASQTATVRAGGILSLYTEISTAVAITADGGTFDVAGGASQFTSVATTAPTTNGVFFNKSTSTAIAVLWTSPTTAGTYTITMRTSVATADTITAATAGGGELGASIIVTVTAAAHGAVGTTNYPLFPAKSNDALFVATLNSTTGSSIVSSSVNTNDGSLTPRSLGLLSKDTSISTAQTATVLTGGVLSLYANVTTNVAFIGSGGSFSGAVVNNSSTNATYSNDIKTVFLPGTSSQLVAVRWIAPTTPGTYTVSMNRASATQQVTPSALSYSSGTLTGAIVVTVVAASAGSAYSAAYSACNTRSASQGHGIATGVDTTSAIVNSTTAYIVFDLDDAYDAGLDNGNIVASATGGALLSLADNGSTAAAGTASTVVGFRSSQNQVVQVVQGTANAPMTSTVTISYNGTTVCTKTITIRGEVAKLVIANVGTGNLSSANTITPGATTWIANTLGDTARAGLFTVVAQDSAGNAVVTNAGGSFAADSATLTTTVQALSVPDTATNVSSTSATFGTTGVGTWTCGATAGSSSVKLKWTNSGSGTVISSDAFTAACAGNPYTYTASWDKASYVAGEIATLTVQFLDSKGVKANNVGSPGALTVTAPMLTAVSATGSADALPNKANGTREYTFTVGKSTGITAGTYVSIVEYASLVAGTKQTPSYKVTTGTTDVEFSEVLKSVVALIASINKQIQALQKLILQRR